MRVVCIYFGPFSHCTGLDCQEVKNSGDKQSVNRSLLGWQGSTGSRIVPPGPWELHFIPLNSVESPSPSLCWPLSCHLRILPESPACPIDSSDLFQRAYVRAAGFGWPYALNMLFITSNLCFHDTSCSSWSLCHCNKGIMKYMVFIWVAVVFVILYMDCYCRKHVKLQRVFFPPQRWALAY